MSLEQKKYWEAGVRYERERILNILKEEQAKRNSNQDWGVIGIIPLMMKIEAGELDNED